ncbi:MAG: SDR family NAD(P)-dependent oxidoreductase [Synechococcus sp.]
MTCTWAGRALVVGAGGIGRALVTALQRQCPQLDVVLCGRQVAAGIDWQVDLESPHSLEALQHKLLADAMPLRLVINASGLLHRDPGVEAAMAPEKRLQQVNLDALLASYSINAAAPLLLAKTIEPCLQRSLPFHYASLSARVGSIGDNRSGGWYAYRGAKAAQNMYLRTLSVEWARRFPLATVLLLHPGTTDTALSKPFQTFVRPEALFSPERAAAQLIDVVIDQGPQQTGSFLAWDGQSIPW